MKQEIVAHKLGVSTSAVSRIESGATVLTVVQLRQLGRIYGVTAAHLLAEAEALVAHIARKSPDVQVVEQRPKKAGAGAAGWFLGGAAVGALVATILSADQEEPGNEY